MSRFPSLIFVDRPKSENILSEDVFSDILLDRIFSKNITGLLKYDCSQEDIKARNEACTAFADEDTLTGALKMHRTISKAKELFDAYSKETSDSVKDFIFVSVKKYIFDFILQASQIKAANGILIDRFKDHFSSLLSQKDHKEESKENDSLFDELKSAGKGMLFIGSNDLRVRKGTEESYFDRIKKAAADLSLWDLEYPQTAPRKLSDELSEAVLKLYPSIMEKAKGYREKYAEKFDKDILLYKDQLALYIRTAEIRKKLSDKGIPFTLPVITNENRIDLKNAYDISLLTKDDSEIIPNDAVFSNSEPFYFLTGANGGGKTTYLRTVGISAVLASRGLPVPCEYAELPLLENVFTHFPKDERFDNESRFIDEVRRVDEIAEKAGKKTLYLLNETYSSTSEEKAAGLTVELARKLKASGAFGIFVIHRKGITENTVPDIPFLTVTIDTDNGNKRTYKIIRADGRSSSYAGDILKKYRLDRASLKERFGVEI